MHGQVEMDFQVAQDRLNDIIKKVTEGQDLFRKEDVVFLIQELGRWARRYAEEAKRNHPEVDFEESVQL